MSDVFFRELDLPLIDINLNVDSGSHGEQTGKMMVGIEQAVEANRPDWILVYGDTNLTLAAALTAAKSNIPLAHVEAGLRSYNRSMPEEIDRLVCDSLDQ
jgi:UDP-N-acetylglucosamine 2-epimerase